MAESEEVKLPARDGEATIKSEFVIADFKRTLNTEFISKDDKEKCTERGEPPKKRLKGQNKNRPRDARIPRNEKFCPCLIENGVCTYGDRCYYLHNAAEYLAKKPVDIQPECYLHKTYGKCIYGITCRFGSKHIDEEGKNIIDYNVFQDWKNYQSFRNGLTKDLQMQLRKRHYDFSPANTALKDFQRNKQKILTDDRIKIESAGSNETDKNAAVEKVLVDQTETLKNSESPVNDAQNLKQTSTSWSGTVTDEDVIKLKAREIKRVDFSKKLYVAPLTTVGNLPFRRICKQFGADITCSEMAVALNLLQGQQSEWALVKRHASEDVFGVQISGAHGDIMSRCAQLLTEKTEIDFIDINVGCPIDIIYYKGAGCALMNRTRKLEEIVGGMRSVMTVPLTAKIRTGVYEHKNTAHLLVPQLRDWGVSLVSIHGRSREQRYTKSADWDYIKKCAELARPMPIFGNGDILSYEDYSYYQDYSSVDGIMLGRGALFKPWIFTEIKEQRHFDISSGERYDILQDYVNYGLEHWGADSEGVEKTRRFLLEWLSFLYRYIPVGLLERPPQKINERPPRYMGRNDLETLMASSNCADWIKISEMLLGPVPHNFSFLPKHKANSYQ